jgi:general L-amino acid transport system permease protein
MTAGFGFLGQPAQFDVQDGVLAVPAGASNAFVLVVGIINTLHVAILAGVVATVVGTAIAILRLLRNPLLDWVATAYIDAMRNVPLLLQLIAWYTLLLALPPARAAFKPVAGIFLSNRGLSIPSLKAWGSVDLLLILVVAAGVFVAVLAAVPRLFKAELSGRTARVAFAIAMAIVFAAVIPDTDLSVPVSAGFNVRGGVSLSPEFLALFVGLSFYYAAFIAEIVRAGLISVTRGQWDASFALGLSKYMTFRRVVMPQALRLITPPLINQYNALLKNSSLAIAIGYPELISVSNSMMNLTGRALECIAFYMAVYLAFNLLISAVGNFFAARMQY